METKDYFKDNIMAVDIFNTKYCHEKEDGELENVADVFWRVCEGLGKYETEGTRVRWHQSMMEGWYRPGGSIISGVGSEQVVSLANCTTIPMLGDSIKDIMKCMSDTMHCAARRQGLGVDVSPLRPAGAPVNNAAVESTGAVPWMDFIQSMGQYVGQKGRLPAILLSLNVSHPDIMTFCKSKSELGVIENANISVQITDDFMKAVKDGAEWDLHFSMKNISIIETVNARELFALISKQACDSAEPGVQFIDEMRAGSMIHQIFRATLDGRFKIISTNACSEKPLVPYGSCMLGSLNMGMFPILVEEYKPILKEKVYQLVHLIDCAITYELENKRYGVDEQRVIMELTREIGLGFTNLHQWFINAGVQYDSDEAIVMIEEFMKWYTFYAFEASQALADVKGPAAAYTEYLGDPYDSPRPVSSFTNKDLMGSKFFANIVNEFYDGDWTKVRPLRNLALMSVAPTGSLSLIFPDTCISSGAEPGMPAHWRRTRARLKGEYEWYFILPSFIKKELLEKIGFMSSFDAKEDLAFIKNVGEATPDNGGELGKEVMEIIERYLGLGTFKPAHEIDPMQKIKMMAGIYKWVDAAVSITYNVPENTTPQQIEDIYMAAWENGVRAVSVYREGSREGILVFEPPTQEVKKTDYCTVRPENIIFNCAPKRDTELPCEIHHCKVKGKNWLVIIGMHNGFPYEIFAGESHEDMYVPQTVKAGVLKKVGKTYSLIVPIRRSTVEYKDIAETFMNEQYRSLTRMISLSLRHGCRPAFITDQLKKADEGITEFSSVVSRVLNKYMKTLDFQYRGEKNKNDKCSNCGLADWHYEGGCKTCSNCGASKCD